MKTSLPCIALVGDYSADVPAHQAIPRAFALIAEETGQQIAWRWVGTTEIRDAARDLADFSAVWVVPASPYRSMNGALAAIRWARETQRPFLGTCGGFQHALIEFARHDAGLREADHGESNPFASVLMITTLTCALDEVSPLRLAPGSLLHEAYGSEFAQEAYRCSFGPNPLYRSAIEQAGLHFTAFDVRDDAVRAAELPCERHPFFVGTLFQPERAALHGRTPPLIRAFVHATLTRAHAPHSPR